MFKRTLISMALLGTLSTLSLAASSPAFASHTPARALFTGYLISAPASDTAPVTFSYQTRDHGVLTVAVSPSTVIVRRYNGHSSLDELSANDVLEIWGTRSGSTLTALRIKDISIQDGWTRFEGRVTAVSPTSISTIVLHDMQHNKRDPFGAGSSMVLPVTASTTVISGTTVITGSTSLFSVGQRIVALGTFDRVQHAFTITNRIHILKK